MLHFALHGQCACLPTKEDVPRSLRAQRVLAAISATLMGKGEDPECRKKHDSPPDQPYGQNGEING